jgi:hypothetical protein
VIAEGSYLLIENLDRMSRQGPWEAMPLFQEIINNGVVIVTLQDGKVWSQAELKENPFRIMESVMVMIRANEESATKSRRLKQAWSAKRSKAGERVLTARAPTWLRLTGEKPHRQFEVIEAKAAVVRRVFELTLSGIGQNKIAEMLNSEAVPTFDRGKMWHRTFIAKLLASEAVIGTYVPHTIEVDDKNRKRRKAAEKVLNYYPSVVDPIAYHDVQAMLLTKAARGRHASTGAVRNVLAGLARCPVCGETATLVSKNKRDRYIVCTRAKAGAGCQYVSVRYSFVEEAVMDPLGQWRKTELDFAGALPEYTAAFSRLEAAQTAVNNLTEAVAAGDLSAALRERLRQAETEQERLEAEVTEFEERMAATAGQMVEARLRRLDAAIAEHSVADTNAALKTLVEHVSVDHRTSELVFKWRHGPETTTLYTFPDTAAG